MPFLLSICMVLAAQMWCLPCPIHMETLTLWLMQDANKWPLYRYKTNQQNLRITYLSKQAIWTLTKSKCRSVTEQFRQSRSVKVIKHHKRKLSSLPLLNRLPLESQAVNKTTKLTDIPDQSEHKIQRGVLWCPPTLPCRQSILPCVHTLCQFSSILSIAQHVQYQLAVLKMSLCVPTVEQRIEARISEEIHTSNCACG